MVANQRLARPFFALSIGENNGNTDRPRTGHPLCGYDRLSPPEPVFRKDELMSSTLLVHRQIIDTPGLVTLSAHKLGGA